MTTESATCCGCNINYAWALGWHPNQIPQPIMAQNWSNPVETALTQGLTEEEKAILQKLSLAWQEYVAIETKDSNLREFNDAIHRCQQLVALRVARRVNPEIWAN